MAESGFSHLRLGRCRDTEWVNVGIVADGRDPPSTPLAHHFPEDFGQFRGLSVLSRWRDS